MQKILALCACDNGHGGMYAELECALKTFSSDEKSWEKIIHRAERHGLASLLYKHIRNVDCCIPKQSRRLLQSLYLRNRSSNSSRNRAVIEIIRACELEKVKVLLVKGIALCNFVYDDLASRPMRDIDLLVGKNDLEKAEKILLDLGYTEAAHHSIPDDYYHLAPLEKIIDGLPVSIELHHNLLPLDPRYPFWPLEKSYKKSQEIIIGGVAARTLSLEDTLHYVYLHGFQAPLSYEPYRLMHVADIVSVVEKFRSELNWAYIRKEMPSLLNSISRFHFLTPWSDEVRATLGFVAGRQPWGVGQSFNGWPLRKMKTEKYSNIPVLLKETLVPSQWWLQIYYGHLNGVGYWKVRWFYHPRTIWRWIKVYYTAYLRNKKTVVEGR